MSAQRYAAMARKHWTTWLPKKVADLKATGELEQAIQAAGKSAAREVLDLMQQGFQQHEAEEVALSQHIILKPEPDANKEQWELDEEAALEKRSRELMGG